MFRFMFICAGVWYSFCALVLADNKIRHLSARRSLADFILIESFVFFAYAAGGQ